MQRELYTLIFVSKPQGETAERPKQPPKGNHIMTALKTVISYSIGNTTYLQSFITVAEMGANAVANLFKAHPELLSRTVTINSVTQYNGKGVAV